MTPACCRDPRQCIVPPYMVEFMARSVDPEVRERALVSLSHCAAVRAVRAFKQQLPMMLAVPSPAGRKHRLVYDARGRDELPGRLVRAEGESKQKDTAVNEAYDYSGATFDFFFKRFGRNSLDNAGMSLISSVHVGEVPSAQTFSTGDKLMVGHLTVQTYPVLHDAADPIGLSVYNSSKRIGIALDMGRPTTLVRQRLKGSDGLILEFNHDIKMLHQCSRPWDVKQRIMSTKGHMSNEAALDFLCELVHEQLSTIILAHISREANSSDHVLSLVSKRLKKIGRSDIEVFPAAQDEVGGSIEI